MVSTAEKIRNFLLLWAVPWAAAIATAFGCIWFMQSVDGGSVGVLESILIIAFAALVFLAVSMIYVPLVSLIVSLFD